MHQPSPLGPVGNDPRNRIALACLAGGAGSVPYLRRFAEVVARYDAARPSYESRSDSIDNIARIFAHFLESGNARSLEGLKFDKGIESGGTDVRLAVGAVVSELLRVSKVSVREQTLREEIVINFVKELLDTPLHPTESGLSELEKFMTEAPAFIDRLVAFERLKSKSKSGEDYTVQDIRYSYRVNEVAVTALRLMVENNMPASVAMKLTEVLPSIEPQGARDEAIDYVKWFVHSSVCSALVGERRLPEPLGRPALLGAVKHHTRGRRYENLGSPKAIHQLGVEVPTSRALWKFFGQRLTALSTIKNEQQRSDRLYRYVVSFREYVAARPFYLKEEQHFRQLNLEGKPAADSRLFYRDDYGVDNGPGREGSLSAEVALEETAKAFRIMAAARYGLNVRKAYARSLSGGEWLFDRMAKELQGETQRFKVADIELYPGPGTRMSGLDIRNALDLSTPESRRFHLKAHPWIGSSMRAGQETEYLFFRGFMAITRPIEAGGRPLSKAWQQYGSFDNEPYAAIIFNDHFYNDWLPEVRMWLVPERVLHRKIMFAVENGVDINKLDVTPEGLAEDAYAQHLVVFDVGCSCVRWGSFANAWPHGEGPPHDWEETSEWAYTRWQSPRHVHRALVGDQYREFLEADVAEVMAKAKVSHDVIKHRVNFFLGLHSSFLTMEESWAKGYSFENEGPARLDIEQPEEEREAGAGRADEEEPREPAGLDELERGASRPRTRMLEYFIEMRNRLIESGQKLYYSDFPNLELQYTRLFSRQAGTPYISGADMMLYLPDGSKKSLISGPRPRAAIYPKIIKLDERLEAMWDQHFVSRFVPNNCPRIIYP